MVSTHPPISKSSRRFNNTLVTVPKAPVTIGVIVTFVFHSFFQFPSKVSELILLFTFFPFYSVDRRDSKVQNIASSPFCCWLLLGLVFCSRLGDPFVCQIPIGVYVCHSPGQICVVHIPFVRMVKSKFLAQPEWITFPTQLCLVLYSFCANLLHSLIMWLMVSSLLPYNLHHLIAIIIIIIIIIIIMNSLEFFTSASADGLSLDFEWQQVS